MYGSIEEVVAPGWDTVSEPFDIKHTEKNIRSGGCKEA